MPEKSAKKILIVDDEPEILEIVRYYLEEAGYAVVHASSVDNAIALFDSSVSSSM